MILAKSLLLASLVLFSKTTGVEGALQGWKQDSEESADDSKSKKRQGVGYQVWAADQSNSDPGQTSLGVKGGFLWIYDSDDIDTQLRGGVNAKPLPCGPTASTGPCNILDIFPQNLIDVTTGKTLASLEGFGRIHGAIPSNNGQYINANMFTPGGAYVGIIDTKTKEAIALFRMTKFNLNGGATSTRSVHMSFWSKDDSAILVANLNGKAIERIDIVKDQSGKIIDLVLDKSATLGLGQGMSVAEDASVFSGLNEHGHQLIGAVIGDYGNADLQDLTPNGACKENGCAPNKDGEAGGRSNNLPICPIPSSNNNLYITLGGGGLLVADLSTTPMSIIGEYGQAVVYGAGCGGAQVKNQMFLNAGVSASGAGATQSMFAVFSFDDNAYPVGGTTTTNPQNTPMPVRVYQDEGNTQTGGNVEGVKGPQDTSGQKPGVTTRRDSHGAVTHPNQKYVYIVDRLQNIMEVFDSATYHRTTFDLTSQSGQAGRSGPSSACYAHSVLDDPKLLLNDPAPDLLDITPDGKYIMVALRGPTPVSVSHSAQGSCPGVGIVELLANGKTGRLIDVIRTTNTIPDNVSITDTTFAGGVAYAGAERSDVHHVAVVPKRMK